MQIIIPALPTARSSLHTYDSYGQLISRQCIAIRPVHPSLLLVRAICYRLEVFNSPMMAIGNRQEVGEKCLGHSAK